MAMAIRISKMLAISCVTITVTTAISIPIIPLRLPARLVAGLDSPRSARMKNTPATR